MSALSSVPVEALQATYEATDWLIPVAEKGVELGHTDPIVLRWLMRLHAACVEDLAHRGERP